jgi:tryptophanyl-tRNA synthetase
MKLVSKDEVIKKYEEDYGQCRIRYGDLKKQLAEDMVTFIAPIREKTESIRNNEKYLRRIMEQGAAKARRSAQSTMALVKESMHLEY